MANSNIYELLSYEQFQEELTDILRKNLDEDFSIEISHVLKNNSVELEGLIIRKENDHVSPNMYLNEYYELYLEGTPVEELTSHMIKLYYDSREDMEEVFDFDFNWDNVKNGVFYRIINREKNKKLLQEVPHLLYLDLAITFQYLVSSTQEGIGSIRIRKDHMQSWGIKLKDLRNMAVINTPRLFPATISSMKEVMMDIVEKEYICNKRASNPFEENNYQPDDTLLETMLEAEGDSYPMYVLTNTKNINGASCILYEGLLREFANEHESDLYILPSSIHEVIIVINDGLISKNNLKQMVVDVNETEVEEEDILSDKVYLYSREKDMIII